MLELFTNPDFLGLLTLDKFRVLIAIIIAILFIWFQSCFYSTDRNARSLYFWVGLIVFTMFFVLNVILTQKASSGIYRPYLIGSGLYDEVEAWQKIYGGEISLMEIQERLSLELWRWSWPGVMAAVVIMLVGAYSAKNPPPKWRRGVGVDVIFSEFPNIVNYSIKAIFWQNMFFGLLCAFATVICFDLLQITALADQSIANRAPPVFFQDRVFDYRFFVMLIMAPLLLVVSYGKVWRIRYRMVEGGLVGYRDAEMRKLANMYRSYEQGIKPDLGNILHDMENTNNTKVSSD